MGTENHNNKQQLTTSPCNSNSASPNKVEETLLVNGTANESGSDDVPYIPIIINELDVIGGAKDILKVIRPQWNFDFVQFKLFTDGITNKLVGCFNNDPTKMCNGIGEHNATTNCDNVVLVRVYGNKTDLLIDRKAETKNIRLLHTYGFAPSLFATFKNGLAYEYVPGVTLTPKTVCEPKIWKLVARRMAEMHKVKVDGRNVNGCVKPMLLSKMEKFFDLVPDQFTDPTKHQRLEKTFLPISKIREEFKFLYNRLEQLNSPIVFSHNDLLLGNVIYTESLNRVTFIDYEYADYNFQAFDIGNHFTEFAGIDEIDYSRYPSKEFQMEWLRVYLEKYLDKDQVELNEIERLYVQVNQFALASHFLWTVWALLQAQHSNISFDFVQFAHMRYGEYLARKNEFLSLELK